MASFITENIVVISLSVSLILIFIYGRCQYLSGYLRGIEEGDKYGITHGDYNNYGSSERSEGYISGFKDGLNRGEQIFSQSQDGWIDEASEWRIIVKKYMEKALDIFDPPQNLNVFDED